MKRALVWIGFGLLLVAWVVFAQQAGISFPVSEQGCEIATLDVGTMEVNSVAFSPDGVTVAVGARDYSIEVWDIPAGRKISTLTGHTDYVYSLTFSPNGKTLASGSRDTTTRMWDVGSGEIANTLAGHADSVLSVAFSPDGTLLASGAWDGTIKLWDVRTGALVRSVTDHTYYVDSVAFSPDGTTLASGSGDRTIKLWDVATGALLITLTGHTEGVTSIAFSPDGTLLASGSGDGTIKLWDVTTRLGLELETLAEHTDRVSCVAFSPDGERLASGYHDAIVKLWDVATGVEMATMVGHLAPILSVVFGPDRRTLASGSEDASIKLWNTAIPSPITKANLLLEVQGVSTLGEMAQQGALARVCDILTRRLAKIGGAQIYQTNSGKIEVIVPAAKYSDELRLLVTTAGYMEFRKVVEREGEPGSSSQLPPPSSSQEILLDRQGRPYLVESAALLNGSSVESVEVLVQQSALTGRTVVSVGLPLSDEGARLFADILGTLNDADTVAIVIDGVVYTAPSIGPAIRMAAEAGWQHIRDVLSIQNISFEDATFLAAVLQNGVLPFPVRVIDAVYPQPVVCTTQQE